MTSPPAAASDRPDETCVTCSECLGAGEVEQGSDGYITYYARCPYCEGRGTVAAPNPPAVDEPHAK